MRRTLIFLCLPVVMGLSGCVAIVGTCIATVAFYALISQISIPEPVVSLHPIWSAEVAAEDARLEGRWAFANDPEASPTPKAEPEPEMSDLFAVTRKGDVYEINFLGDDGEAVTTLTARLAKIGELTYLDIKPVPKGTELLSIQSHYLIQMEWKGETLRLAVLDRTKLESLLREPGATLSAEEADDKLVLTSKTADLQAFFRAHGPELKGFPFHLRRK